MPTFKDIYIIFVSVLFLIKRLIKENNVVMRAKDF